MMIGVVLPVGYMMFRNKRVPSSSSYTKQTNKVLIQGDDGGSGDDSDEVRRLRFTRFGFVIWLCLGEMLDQVRGFDRSMI